METHPRRPRKNHTLINLTVTLLGFVALYATYTFDPIEYFQRHEMDVYIDGRAQWVKVLSKEEKPTSPLWGPEGAFLNFGPTLEIRTPYGMLRVDRATFDATSVGGQVCAWIQESTQSHSVMQALAFSPESCTDPSPTMGGE